MSNNEVRKALTVAGRTIPGAATIKSAHVAGATVKQIARELGLGCGYIASVVR